MMHYKAILMNKPEINIKLKRNVAPGLHKGWLKSIVQKTLKAEGITRPVEMGLLITDNDTIQKLNRVYRGENEPTDVLSFQTNILEGEEAEESFVSAPDGINHLGEVIISYPKAEEQARERGYDISQELTLLIIHGTLHLLGYDHEVIDDERTMREKESRILAQLTGN